MAEKIVLRGIARSKGKAKAQAMVFSHRFGYAINLLGNEDGEVMTAGWDHHGESIEGKSAVYPTIVGCTGGVVSLYYKCTQSGHGPVTIICRETLPFDKRVKPLYDAAIPMISSLRSARLKLKRSVPRETRGRSVQVKSKAGVTSASPKNRTKR